MNVEKTTMPSKSGEKGKKVFDVAKPGKTAASASARPLIIGHKTMIRDPMVKESEVDGLESDKPATAPVVDKLEEDKSSGEPDTSTNPAESASMSPSSTKINIKPPEEMDKTNEPDTEEVAGSESKDQSPLPEEAEKVEVNTKPKDASPQGKPEESNEEEPEKPVARDEDTGQTGSDEAALDAVAVQALEKKNKQEEEAERIKQEKLHKLIQQKKYYAPIGAKTRKKNIRTVLIALIIMIIVAIGILYLLIDANIVDIGVKIPYNIIK